MRRILLTALASILVLPLLQTSAAAAVTCTYNAAQRRVFLSISADETNDFAIAVGLNSAILFGRGSGVDSVCEAATATNTDQIVVTGSSASETLHIQQGIGLRFAPGATSESSGASEIEFSVDLGGDVDAVRLGGTTQDDTMVFGVSSAGTPQAAVNGDADSDIQFRGVEEFVAFGQAGSDFISGQGGNGTGRAFSSPLRLVGSEGNDVIIGGLAEDTIEGFEGGDNLNGAAGDDEVNGQDGNDVIIGGPGDDELTSSGGGPDGDTYIPGPGADDVTPTGSGVDTVSYAGATGPVSVLLAQNEATGEGTDTLSSIENVIGSNFGDTLSGNSARNFLQGRDGDDLLQGAQEADSLMPGFGTDDVRGGAGLDTVVYADSGVPVSVDLAAGVGAAQGTDAISLVENVTGSFFPDELTGSAGPNVLVGLDGSDRLSGLAGDDVLDGGLGNDALDGGPGTDQCFQGPGAGTLTSCETVGTSDLKPGDATVRVGEPLTYTVTWTHPRRWRRLDTVELRVRNGHRVLAWVRWNQEGNTFQLFRPGAGRFGPAAPGGSNGTLSSPFAVLHLRGSDALAISPQTIGVTMRLSFRRAAIGDHVVEVTAEDDRNNRDAWHPAGTLTIR